MRMTNTSPEAMRVGEGISAPDGAAARTASPMNVSGEVWLTKWLGPMEGAAEATEAAARAVKAKVRIRFMSERATIGKKGDHLRPGILR